MIVKRFSALFSVFLFAYAELPVGGRAADPTVIPFYREYNQAKALGDTEFDFPGG